LTPQAEIDGDMGDAQMGLQARLMSQAMRKLTAIIGKSRTILIFINQIRMKIGVMFGNPETTTGGNALKFYASVRLEVRKIETIEAGKDVDAVGNRVRVKVVKNKVAPPFRRAELDVIFGKGVSAIGSLLDAAVKYEIIDKKGAWYSYGEEKVGQGRDSALSYLEQNAEFAKNLEARLRKLIFPGREFPAPAAEGKAAGIAGTETMAPAPGPVPLASPPPAAGSGPAANPAGQGAAGFPRTESPAAVPRPVPVIPPAAARPAAAPRPGIAASPGPAPGPANPGEPPHRGPGRPRKFVPPAGDPDALF
jgi:recombination protein RecA